MIVDSHCHIVPPSFRDRRAELASRDATFASMLASEAAAIADSRFLVDAMERDGVDLAVAMGMGWADYDLAVEANDYIIESVAQFPQRIRGFASVNPRWGQRAVEEAERCAAAGLCGIGELHPDTQGIDITNGDSMAPLMDAARRLSLPVLLHCSEPAGHKYPGKGATTPDKVWRFIQDFPDNVIVCAHWGGGLPFYALMPEVAARLSNVYFDSAASPFLYSAQVYATVCSLLPAERILFASDYPLMRQSRALADMEAASLPEHVRRLILGENAVRMLGVHHG